MPTHDGREDNRDRKKGEDADEYEIEQAGNKKRDNDVYRIRTRKVLRYANDLYNCNGICRESSPSTYFLSIAGVKE